MKKHIIITTLLCFIFISGSSTGEYLIQGMIDTIRADKTVTIAFKKRPSARFYYLIQKKERVGRVSIINISYSGNAQYPYNIIGKYRLFNKRFYLIAGSSIYLSVLKKKKENDFSHEFYIEKPRYPQIIISPIDKRTMLFVPAGKFYRGASGFDQSPVKKIYLDAYYIDKYEVSNNDFLHFVMNTSQPHPPSWKFKINNEMKFIDTKFGNLPVIVSYYEARAYARWSGKRLPTEEEWEKGARGLLKHGKRMYPWGKRFKILNANTLNYWKVKKRSPRLLSIRAFPLGKSPLGLFNMSGNAPEWTSSWYRAYPGSYRKNSRFGTQYKVIRGGGWYMGAGKATVTHRIPGGLPNLYEDRSAGFRCVRDATVIDRVD